MRFLKYARHIFVVVGVFLAGCASNVPAPVTERGQPRSVENGVAAVALKPGEYMVKKGDTLRSIALEHGQEYKELAAWNHLDNPDVINVGQVLRVVPPESQPAAAAPAASGAIEMRAIAPPAQVESIPMSGAGTVPAAASGGLKREPKGGTQPYSDDAWARMQNAQTAAPVQPATASAPQSSPLPPDSAPKTAAAVPDNADVAWQWPTPNAVIANFSESTNKGIDFGGKVGDPVYAAAPGKVTLVTNSLRGYGNLIVVKHNASYLSVYAHNSKMLVNEGQLVTKGQKIAEIGSTDTDRPQLHFEIRREGKPVDPTKFLPQR